MIYKQTEIANLEHMPSANIEAHNYVQVHQKSIKQQQKYTEIRVTEACDFCTIKVKEHGR